MDKEEPDEIVTAILIFLCYVNIEKELGLAYTIIFLHLGAGSKLVFSISIANPYDYHKIYH